jgi:hypothetical protein
MENSKQCTHQYLSKNLDSENEMHAHATFPHENGWINKDMAGRLLRM